MEMATEGEASLHNDTLWLVSPPRAGAGRSDAQLPVDHVLRPMAWEARTVIAAAWEDNAPDGMKLSDHSGLVVGTGERFPACAAFGRDE